MKPFYYYKMQAKEQLFGRAGKPVLIAIFTMLLTFIVNFVISGYYAEDVMSKIIYYVLNILSVILVVQPIQMGATVFYMKFTRDKEASVGTVFDGYKYLKRLIPYLIITLALSLISSFVTDFVTGFLLTSDNVIASTDNIFLEVEITVISLLVMSAIIYIINMYLSFTFYILYDDEEISGFKAVIKSIKMTKKYILYLIGLNLSFILWFIASAFTMGIILLYVKPYMDITLLMAYEDIKNMESINSADIEGGNE